MNKQNLEIEYVPVASLIPCEYNPRTWSDKDKKGLKESIVRYGLVDPILVNCNEERKNVVIGGNFRLNIAQELGHETVPVVFINLTLEKERELNIRLNKNHGDFDLELLSHFDDSFLSDIGFDTEELDSIFNNDDGGSDQTFDLKKALDKIGITEVTVQKGDVYDLDGSRLCCGDSTILEDMIKLCGEDKVDMVMTDPPYRLDYLKGKKRNGVPTEGFGLKKNRKYLETDELPLDFTEKWMNNVAQVQASDFSIVCYENWKNLREIWNEMEKHWKVKNMIVWHVPNRNQGYAGKHKLFSKHDIAMVGTSDQNREPYQEQEEEFIENEYETALYAIAGKPHWESYGKGKKYCPTDFIEHVSADEKSSGQSVIFGVKPVEILIPYIKIMSKRGQTILEPFGGSGSTLIASNRIGRRCFIMEKSPVYAEVIINRWEKWSGKKRKKIS